MKNNKPIKKSTKTTLSAKVAIEIKETLEEQGPLRQHTLSEAVDLALKLGTPLYLKRFPKKFQPADNA